MVTLRCICEGKEIFWCQDTDTMAALAIPVKGQEVEIVSKDANHVKGIVSSVRTYFNALGKNKPIMDATVTFTIQKIKE